MDNLFEIKRISTAGAYNSARYKKAAAEKKNKPFLISYDGKIFPEVKMIAAALLLCETLDVQVVCIADRHKDEVTEITYKGSAENELV